MIVIQLFAYKKGSKSRVISDNKRPNANKLKKLNELSVQLLAALRKC